VYDSNIIKQFAENLYTQATVTIVLFTAAGFFIPLLFGFFMDSVGVGFIAGILLGVGGYFYGQSRAFQLKLQAQTALCQVKIEENTRSYKKLETGSEIPRKDNRIFKGETPLVGTKPSDKRHVTPEAINYRTCIKCLHQNSKIAKFCSRCGYEFK
jgi:hypothetical protein